VKFLDQIRTLFTRRKAAIPLTPQPSALAVEHRLASAKIVVGYVRVTNESGAYIVLEGGALGRLIVPPMSFTLVKSPILENVSRYKGRDGVGRPIMELAYINEWDALEVVENMIEEYARGRAYDLMSPAELKACTFPLPKRAMAELIAKIGLKAQRENESNPAQAR